MCALLPAWLWLLLGLLPLEVQPRALTHRHRSSSPRHPKLPSSSPHATPVPTASDLDVVPGDHVSQGDGHFIWRVLPRKEEPPLRSPDPPLDRSDRLRRDAPVRLRGSRGRRHANSGSGRGHGQLMRVGCVLGTCQVQNLSHRLYQLIGQSGREDSSPINPRSPHSYG